jgi:opacity protein-like surface antigen
MKKFIAASLSPSLLAAVQPAIAADMPVKAPAYKAPVFVVDPWTALYAGLNAGYSWGPWASSNPASVGNANFFNGMAFVNSASPRVDVAIGGAQIGYNWLVAKNFLLGVEADFQWSGAKAGQNGGVQLFDVVVLDNHFIGSAATTNDWKSRWFSTFRARAGFVTTDQWLINATGGLALINAQYSTSATATLRRTTARSFRQYRRERPTAKPARGWDLRSEVASGKNSLIIRIPESSIFISTAARTVSSRAPVPTPPFVFATTLFASV